MWASCWQRCGNNYHQAVYLSNRLSAAVSVITADLPVYRPRASSADFAVCFISLLSGCKHLAWFDASLFFPLCLGFPLKAKTSDIESCSSINVLPLPVTFKGTIYLLTGGRLPADYHLFTGPTKLLVWYPAARRSLYTQTKPFQLVALSCCVLHIYKSSIDTKRSHSGFRLAE